MYEKRGWVTNMMNIDILLFAHPLYNIHRALFLTNYRLKNSEQNCVSIILQLFLLNIAYY